MRIVIIGAGNVGTNLEYAFKKRGAEVRLVSSRVGLDDLPPAEVYIYTIKDIALQEVVNQVHGHKQSLHLHTSGTMPLDVFGEDKPHCGILYAFQSFSKTKLIEHFEQVPIFLQTRQKEDYSKAKEVAEILTPMVYAANEHDRGLLHVAGVFANNFANQMYDVAAELLAQTNIPFDVLLPLIDETAHKVHTLPPKQAQTGPACRHDTNVMEHHIQLLPNEEMRDIYRLLSQRIMREH